MARPARLPRSWEVAPQLAEQAVTVADLDELRTLLGGNETCVSLQFFARYLRSSRSVQTLAHSTARIFDLIDAIKAYSDMDRAPILEVDVPAGLDATVQMLHSRMTNVQIERDYEPDLPLINAYGGELNQVWTALIENALDALGNQGRLRLACRLEGEMMLVEIWDTGPGIPPELQERIFEPFFTTKAPGQGLGLGLDNAMRIVRKHRGHIERPLRTRLHLLPRPPAARPATSVLTLSHQLCPALPSHKALRRNRAKAPSQPRFFLQSSRAITIVRRRVFLTPVPCSLFLKRHIRRLRHPHHRLIPRLLFPCRPNRFNLRPGSPRYPDSR